MPDWNWAVIFAVTLGGWGHWLYMKILGFIDNPYRWRCPYCITEKKKFYIKLNDRDLRDDLKRQHVKTYHPERWPFYAEPD